MRIAFDGTNLMPGRTGVGYYSEHLLHHLVRAVEETGDELVVLSHRPLDATVALPPHVRVHTPKHPPLKIAWIQFLAARALAEVGADVAHFTNAMVPLVTRVPTVVTIHDMSLRLHARCHPWRRLVTNRPLLALAARRADAVVTVSESSRADLLRLHRLPPDRVHVVPEAAAPSFAPVTDPAALARVRARHRLPAKFLLYVGAIEPRKNLPRLMDAFRSLRARGLEHELVLVGPYGWSSRDLAPRIARLGLRDVVHFAGYVPAADLPAIYTLADLFVFPSIYEGFGLPVVEAMACGTPVVTTESSSLREIAGDAAEIVNPFDTQAIADAIERVVRDPRRRQELSARGRARAGAFSWARSAREMLRVYRETWRAATEPAPGLVFAPDREKAPPVRVIR